MDRATERALFELATEGTPQGGAGGNAVVHVERVGESRYEVRGGFLQNTYAFREEALAAGFREVAHRGGGVVKYREAGGEWRTIEPPRQRSRPAAPPPPPATDQPPVQPARPDEEPPAPPAPAARPRGRDEERAPEPAPRHVQDPEPVDRLTVQVADIPDVMEVDEASFVLQSAPMRRRYLAVAGHRLRRAGYDVIGIESPVGSDLWSHAYVMRGPASIWLLANLDDLMSPLWAQWARDQKSVTQFEYLCPMVVEALRTNVITVTIDGRRVPVDVQRQVGERTVVGFAFSEPVVPVLSGRVLVLAGLVAELALRVTGEIFALTSFTRGRSGPQVDWMKKIGDTADTAKKVLDFFATFQKVFGN